MKHSNVTEIHLTAGWACTINTGITYLYGTCYNLGTEVIYYYTILKGLTYPQIIMRIKVRGLVEYSGTVVSNVKSPFRQGEIKD